MSLVRESVEKLAASQSMRSVLARTSARATSRPSGVSEKILRRVDTRVPEILKKRPGLGAAALGTSTGSVARRKYISAGDRISGFLNGLARKR